MGKVSFMVFFGKITHDLIISSPKNLNPCNDYELDLRDNRIVSVENLEMTEDQYDSIDLSAILSLFWMMFHTFENYASFFLTIIKLEGLDYAYRAFFQI